VWLMQPEAQTNTPGILAVSAGALEVLLQYIEVVLLNRSIWLVSVRLPLMSVLTSELTSIRTIDLSA